MTDEYSRSVLKVVVAQICQTIGYSSVNSTPYEFLVDLMEEYMLRIARLTHQYSETRKFDSYHFCYKKCDNVCKMYLKF